ncbi:MAG: HAD family hydrolase [Chloroflexota bacterium]
MRLIVSDIDDTLVHKGMLPPRNRDVLSQALAQDVRLVLATVRKYDSAMQVVQKLRLPCTLICQGGATMYDEQGKQLHQTTIPLELAHQIAELADQEHLPLLTTIDEHNYYSAGSHPRHYIKATGTDITSHRAILQKPPSRFLIRGERGVLLMEEHFGTAPLHMVRHYNARGHIHDAAITHIDATKQKAVAWLCHCWGILPTHVLAIGDSESDIGMITWAGMGVAMENAHPSVRDAADWVAPSVQQAGLASAVTYFLRGSLS